MLEEFTFLPLNPPLDYPAQYADAYWTHTADYMNSHQQIPLVLTVLYVVVIFGLKFVMKSKKAFGLEVPLMWWNVFLALFSIAGASQTLPALVENVLVNGFESDMCTSESEYANPWVMLFCLSKIPEFIDTLFIVLRKKPLIFLHWYHHIATMWFCWIAWSVRLPNGGMFAVMNLLVHSIMYSYYASTAYGWRWSAFVRSTITKIQIFQMVVGTAIVIHNIVLCNTHPFENYAGLIMYISYFFLFVQLYINSYKRDQAERAKRREQAKKEKKE